jgi:hypothetical protein
MEKQPIQSVESNETIKKPDIVFVANNTRFPRKKRFFDEDEESVDQEFKKSMQVLAEACIGQEKLEFLILLDPLALNIVGSSQSFFNEDLENELAKVGINVKVFGIVGGSSEGIIKAIKEKYPDWEGFLPQGRDNNDYLLYKVENSSGK